MAALRSSMIILGPPQLWFLLLAQNLRAGSFQKTDVRDPSLTTEPLKPETTLTWIAAGKTLILTCPLTPRELPVSAKWYKDLGNDEVLIYRERDKFSRGMRLLPGSRTDFSIRIDDVGPDDNGTYCCSTVTQGLQRVEYTVKKQVEVFVMAPPTVYLETDPPSPVQLNTTVTVTCKAEYFYPDGAKLDFFCKHPGGKGKAAATTLNANGTYSRQSHMKITATENWNASLFTCLVKHNSQAAIKATARLFITTEPGKSYLHQPIFGLWVGLFLNKLGLVFFFMSLFKIKARRCCFARHFASSSSQG